MKLLKNLSLAISVLVLSLAMLNGCSSDDTISPTIDNLQFSGMFSRDTSDASAPIIIDSVKVLFKDIKLNVSGSNDSTNFKVGPYMLKANLQTGVNTITSGMIPEGTYDKVKFEIHKLENNETPPDPEFADSTNRYSIVVKGSYLGVPFIFKSDKSAHQKLTFPNSLVVTAETSNITILMMPYVWFIKNGVYMDPNLSANKNDIENNIKNNINNNFKAFKDNDKNGIPDN